MKIALILLFTCLQVTAAELTHQQIAERLEKVINDVKIDDIQPSPVTNLLQVTAGMEVFYVTPDAKHFFYGTILDLDKNKNSWNITEQVRAASRLQLLSDLDMKQMIIYPAKNKQVSIKVFTDIDCGFCRKFHSNMDKMNNLGIEVGYLAFPRAGVGSASFNKSISVWCNSDSNNSMTEAKLGRKVPENLCGTNPVTNQFELGKRLGVRGTPTVLFENGTMISSYLEPEKILELAKAHAAGN